MQRSSGELKIMAGQDLEMIEGSLKKSMVGMRGDQAKIVEEDLIAEVVWLEEEVLIVAAARGTEMSSNAETYSENSINRKSPTYHPHKVTRNCRVKTR
jgi:hypothetical protein